MLLRNKKTGDVIDLDIANIKAQFGGISVIPEPVILGGDEFVYHSLAELNADWEDYEPAKPLIKDEKIRKAVRAWAEANRVTEARYSSCHDAECEFNARDDENKSIVFIGNFTEMNKELDYRTIYTIDELCGEEEE